VQAHHVGAARAQRDAVVLVAARPDVDRVAARSERRERVIATLDELHIARLGRRIRPIVGRRGRGEEARAVDRHREQVVAGRRVPDVDQRLAVGADRRLHRPCLHVGDLGQRPLRKVVGVDVEDPRPVRDKIERLPVGRKDGVLVERAVAGDLLEAAGGDVDDPHVAVAARRPDAVGERPAVRREARRVHLLEAPARHELAPLREVPVGREVGDLEVPRAPGVHHEHELRPIGADVSALRAQAGGEPTATWLAPLGRRRARGEREDLLPRVQVAPDRGAAEHQIA
jgi:hypothetical protein